MVRGVGRELGCRQEWFSDEPVNLEGQAHRQRHAGGAFCVVQSLGREHTPDVVRAWRMGEATSRPRGRGHSLCSPPLGASRNVLWGKRFWSFSHSPRTVPGNCPVAFFKFLILLPRRLLCCAWLWEESSCQPTVCLEWDYSEICHWQGDTISPTFQNRALCLRKPQPHMLVGGFLRLYWV